MQNKRDYPVDGVTGVVGICHMPEWLRDLWLFFKSIALGWINVLGGTVLFAIFLCYKSTTGEKPPVTYLWILGSCLCVAAFLAWRDERRKNVGKLRHLILTEIAQDSAQRFVPPGEIRCDLLGLIITHYNDFNDEYDVRYVCDRLAETHYDPFESLRIQYGYRTFRRNLLPFMRGIRESGWPYYTQHDVNNYVKSVWADSNGLKEREGAEFERVRTKYFPRTGSDRLVDRERSGWSENRNGRRRQENRHL